MSRSMAKHACMRAVALLCLLLLGLHGSFQRAHGPLSVLAVATATAVAVAERNGEGHGTGHVLGHGHGHGHVLGHGHGHGHVLGHDLVGAPAAARERIVAATHALADTGPVGAVHALASAAVSTLSASHDVGVNAEGSPSQVCIRNTSSAIDIHFRLKAHDMVRVFDHDAMPAH